MEVHTYWKWLLGMDYYKLYLYNTHIDKCLRTIELCKITKRLVLTLNKLVH